MCRNSIGCLCAQKKRGTFSPSLESLRSSTTLSTQLQRVKPTPYGGSVVALLWVDFESVEVSKIKLLRFFLFYGVHKRVMRFFSYAICLVNTYFSTVFSFEKSGCKDNYFSDRLRAFSTLIVCAGVHSPHCAPLRCAYVGLLGCRAFGTAVLRMVATCPTLRSTTFRLCGVIGMSCLRHTGSAIGCACPHTALHFVSLMWGYWDVVPSARWFSGRLPLAPHCASLRCAYVGLLGCRAFGTVASW